jgi:hypothetical protein
MSTDRDSLIAKIRALMSKTVSVGCSEPEALAALDKARALMDAYEVTEAELQLTKAETAILRSEPPARAKAEALAAAKIEAAQPKPQGVNAARPTLHLKGMTSR